jgi:hypothetical protein
MTYDCTTYDRELELYLNEKFFKIGKGLAQSKKYGISEDIIRGIWHEIPQVTERSELNRLYDALDNLTNKKFNDKEFLSYMMSKIADTVRKIQYISSNALDDLTDDLLWNLKAGYAESIILRLKKNEKYMGDLL